jgi:hypothetical protein
LGNQSRARRSVKWVLGACACLLLAVAWYRYDERYVLRGAQPASTDTPTELVDAVATLDLAVASYAAPLAADTHVVINQDAVYFEAKRLADVRRLVANRRVEELPELAWALAARRKRWQTTHPGKAFPGTILFWVDSRIALWPVACALKTAVLAGYPNLRFATRSKDDPHRHGQLTFFTRIPNQPGQPTTNGPARALAMTQNSDLLAAWGGSSEGEDELNERPTRLSWINLESELLQLWSIEQARRPSVQPQQAVIAFAFEGPFAELLRAIDTLSQPRPAASSNANATASNQPLFMPFVDFSSRAYPKSLADDFVLAGQGLRFGVLGGVNWPMDSTNVNLTLRSYAKPISNCYVRALEHRPDLAGSIVVRFVVGRDGNVESAEADVGRLNAELRDCVVHTFQAMRFWPPPIYNALQCPIIFGEARALP